MSLELFLFFRQRTRCRIHTSWQEKLEAEETALDVPRSNCSDELVHLLACVLATLAVGDVLCVWTSVYIGAIVH